LKNLKGRHPLVPRLRGQYDIKVYLKGMGCDGMDFTNLGPVAGSGKGGNNTPNSKKGRKFFD
jgi:hypothetical protein